MTDTRIDEYIEKQKSPQKEICYKLRNIILQTFPEIEEKMKWGVPSYEDGKYYFVALKTHVNLGFSIIGFPKEKAALFQGSGKTMRIIEIKTENEINEEFIVKLLKLVQEK